MTNLLGPVPTPATHKTMGRADLQASAPITSEGRWIVPTFPRGNAAVVAPASPVAIRPRAVFRGTQRAAGTARPAFPRWSVTAIKLRRERQSLGFRWLSGVEANGTQGGGQFASTPLSERLT